MLCFLIIFMVFSIGSSDDIKESKLLILGGTGAMGHFVVTQSIRYLDQGIYESITITGRDKEKGKRVISRIQHNLVFFEELDISEENSDKLVSLMSAHDIVISCVGPFQTYSSIVIQAAIDAGKPLFDINDEVEPIKDVFKKYDRLARENEVGLYLGYGFSPGITSFLARYGMDQLDEEEHAPFTIEVSLAVDITDSVGPASHAHAMKQFGIFSANYSYSSHALVSFFGYEDDLGHIDVVERDLNPIVVTFPHYFGESKVEKVVDRFGTIPSFLTGLIAACEKLKIIGGRMRDHWILHIGKGISSFMSLFHGEEDERGSFFRVDVYGKMKRRAHVAYQSARPMEVGELTGFAVAVSAMLYATDVMDTSNTGFMSPGMHSDPKGVFLDTFVEEMGLSYIEIFPNDEDAEYGRKSLAGHDHDMFMDYRPHPWINLQNVFVGLLLLPVGLLICSTCCGCGVGSVVFWYVLFGREKRKRKIQ